MTPAKDGLRLPLVEPTATIAGAQRLVVVQGGDHVRISTASHQGVLDLEDEDLARGWPRRTKGRFTVSSVHVCTPLCMLMVLVLATKKPAM